MQKIFSGTSEGLNTELQNGWKFVGLLRSYKGSFSTECIDVVLESVENNEDVGCISKVTVKDAVLMIGIKFEATLELSIEFQEEFFKVGGKWSGNKQHIINNDKQYFCVREDSKLCWMFSHQFDSWKYKQIELVSSRKKHIHADIMMEYAKLAQEHEEPWKFVEVGIDHVGIDYWVTCLENPHWDITRKYRIKK